MPAWEEQFSEVWTRMRADDPVPIPDSKDSYMQLAATRILPEQDMQGGQLAWHMPVWERLADEAGRDADMLRTLQWVREGVSLQFCDTSDKQKALEPDHGKKVSGVRAMLREAGHSGAEAAAMMRGAFPQPALLRNGLGSDAHDAFADEKVAEAERVGAVRRWPFEGKPWCVNPLRVDQTWAGKLRLILDCRYLNLFLQYFRFYYERCCDLVDMAEVGDFMYVLDFKAGYHHLLVHPKHWGLLGFQLRGQFYVFTSLPFGLSQAPWVFTQLMRSVYQLPRSLGWPLTAMIDDAAGTGAGHKRMAWRALAHMWLLAPLGFTFGAAQVRRLARAAGGVPGDRGGPAAGETVGAAAQAGPVRRARARRACQP